MNELKNVSEIRHNLTSVNGYEIFDLMVPTSTRGHISCNDYCLYSEDESVIKELETILDEEWEETNWQENEKLNNLLKKHPDIVHHIYDIKTLGHPECLVFDNLKNKEKRKNTDKNYFLGHKRFFHDNSLVILNSNPNSKNSELFENYKKGKIRATCIFKGKILERIFSDEPELLEQVN